MNKMDDESRFKVEFIPCILTWYEFKDNSAKKDFYISQWNKISDDPFPEILLSFIPMKETMDMYFNFIKAHGIGLPA